MRNLLQLKQAKKNLKLTNKELAEKCNIPLGTINKIFSGSTKLSLENYNKLASVLTENNVENTNYNYVLTALANLNIKLGDVEFNTNLICDKIQEFCSKGAEIISFQEYSLIGSSIGSLINSDSYKIKIESAINKIANFTKGKNAIVFVGTPIYAFGKVNSCAVAFCNGEVLGVTPKNYKDDLVKITLCGKNIDYGNVIYCCKNLPSLKIACEFGEDLFNPIPTSTISTTFGANVIVNLSSCQELVGLEQNRINQIISQSKKCVCAYLFNNAGFGESSTDYVYSGQKIIAENGKLLEKSQIFSYQDLLCEIDLDYLEHERVNRNFNQEYCSYINFDIVINGALKFRKFSKTPFIPQDKVIKESRFEQILQMQVEGLKRRIIHVNSKKAVIGISGGLDSALALLVMVRTFKQLGKDLKDILAITMPCFGTSGRTYNNALGLCKELGVELKEVNIKESVLKHFADIGHDSLVTDVTYENSQARERTQVLMDMANKVGGIVVGTGDLSELALGWATYNGDHMSNYGVNASIPKTLVRELVCYEALKYGGKIKEHLLDIVDTPVSPELTPAENGIIKQKTEDLVGPYILHDFYLYYLLRKGYSARKVYYLAQYVFRGEFTKETIYRWLYTFIKRFFAMQFKRSCLPDGVAVGSVGVSPRGAFSMPSDAYCQDWLKELESVKNK